MSVMELFHPVVSRWFAAKYGQPTPPQVEGWPAITSGHNVLIFAPTGSGKTLAAFLQCLNWLYQQVELGHRIDGGTQILYISPLKALNNDIHKNLEGPLTEISQLAREMGVELPKLEAAVRTGDTSASQRQRIVRKPPHILITTPESLFLMLASKQQRVLTTVRFVIVDEIHALFGGKRGTHLSLSLEYLEELTQLPLQRIGLSATLKPVEKVAEFLGGGSVESGQWQPRPVRIVDTGARKNLDLRVELPSASLSNLPEKTIWPSIYRYLLDQVRQHRSTLVFVNSRRVAENTAAQLNKLASRELARVHHGSLSRESREEVEQMLKRGELSCLVTTSSLELGIDVGSIDCVVQVESPHEVARGLQRVGRAGHVVGLPSKGRIVVKTQDDLLEAAVIAQQMGQGDVERVRMPENCLDVLAQQIVGMTAVRDLSQNHLLSIVRRAAAYRNLPTGTFEQVLAMLSGQLGEGDQLGLRPRIYWDQIGGVVQATEGGKRLVYTSGGTIPDRGYYGVYQVGSTVRLGELEEEFVYERRIGDRFVLGTNVWRVEEIRQDRVIVAPAGGAPTVPFWKGEGFGRPYDLGRTYGDFLARVEARMANENDSAVRRWLQDSCKLDELGGAQLHRYLQAQREAVGSLPTSRRLVIEEFPDELGQWRVVLYSPFGKRVNRPLTLLLTERIRQEQGLELASVQLDDGIMFIGPTGAEPPAIDPQALSVDGLEETLANLASRTPLFASLFRENAGRALMLPKQGYGRKRTPFWLARLKAADLLQVVSKYPDFPIVVETYRQILHEVFDLQGVKEVLAHLRSGTVEVVRCRRKGPSPFAQPMLFSMMADFMYAPDQSRSDQRLTLLNMGRETLRELLDEADLRTLLDPVAVSEAVERASAGLAKSALSGANEFHAWLLQRGELLRGADGEWEMVSSLPQAQPRLTELVEELEAAGRTRRVAFNVGPQRRQGVVPTELLSQYQVALPKCMIVGSVQSDGPTPPDLVPTELSPQAAVRSIILRFAANCGPFTAEELAARYGLTKQQIDGVLRQLREEGILESGQFIPGGTGTEWCDTRVLQRIHRRSLVRARKAVQPRSQAEYTRFLSIWHGAGPEPNKSLSDVLSRLSGHFLVAGLWERCVLPARVKGYTPAQLDQLLGSGLFSWRARRGASGFEIAIESTGMQMDNDVPTSSDSTFPGPDWSENDTEVDPQPRPQGQILRLLHEKGALSVPQLWQYTGIPVAQLLVMLEDLMLDGVLTNDSFGAVRFFLAGNPFREVKGPSRRPLVVSPEVLAQMGRWSLVPTQAAEPSQENAERQIGQIARLYGVVCRETATAAGVDWSVLGATLSRWEMVGKIRRGYFIDGVSGIQYAHTEAVEGLRRVLDTPARGFVALPMGDPANPWGAVLPWPGERRPKAEAVLVLFGGEVVLSVEGTRVRTHPASAKLDGDQIRTAVGKLVNAIKAVRGTKIEIRELDGQPIEGTGISDLLIEYGFERAYKGLVSWG